MSTSFVNIFEFEDPAEWSVWRVVNDTVMGGVSRAEILGLEPGLAVFTGQVSLENDGGFASVRATLAPGRLTGTEALEIRVRGDGKRYQLRLRPDAGSDGINYGLTFVTEKDIWQVIRLPYSELVPTFRGRRVAGAPAFDPTGVRQLGFLIGDRQAGPFRLEIDYVRAVGPELPAN